MSVVATRNAAIALGRIPDRKAAADRFATRSRLAGVTATIVVAMIGTFSARAAEPAGLVLEATVALGPVRGRIDHLTIDADRQRLYVAELGNDSVGVVDLKRAVLLSSITGLKEPQGVLYVPTADMVYVANAGDGSIRVFNGADLNAVNKIDLGDDADNMRFDRASNLIYVGYGSGALAVIDPMTRKKIANVTLHAHPESFQLESGGHDIFINVPDAREIAVVDRVQQKQVASWKPRELTANFPMAIESAGHRVLVVFRHPATLGVFDLINGALLSRVAVCGDADDIFVDGKRDRVYVSCGEGFIDVLARDGDSYVLRDRIATAPGARTALFVPEMDRLLLAVRSTSRTAAAIWVFRPAP